MTKRKAEAAGWVVGAVLATAAGSVTAGGVYIGAENEAINPMKNAAPRVEFRYDCTGTEGEGSLEPGDALEYCSSGMDVEVTAWNPLKIGSTKQTIGSWTLSGNDDSHCAEGEAEVWTVFTVQAEGDDPGVGADIRQESDCESE